MVFQALSLTGELRFIISHFCFLFLGFLVHQQRRRTGKLTFMYPDDPRVGLREVHGGLGSIIVFISNVVMDNSVRVPLKLGKPDSGTFHEQSKPPTTHSVGYVNGIWGLSATSDLLYAPNYFLVYFIQVLETTYLRSKTRYPHFDISLMDVYVYSNFCTGPLVNKLSNFKGRELTI